MDNAFIDNDFSEEIDIVHIFDELISDRSIRPTTILAFLEKYTNEEKHSILCSSRRIPRILFVGYAIDFKDDDVEFDALVKIANYLGESVYTNNFFASIKKFIKDSSIIKSLDILKIKSYNVNSNPYSKSIGRYREQYDIGFMKLFDEFNGNLSRMLSYVISTSKFESNFELMFSCPLFLRFFQLDVFDSLNEDDKAKFILRLYGYCSALNIKHYTDGALIYCIKNFIIELLNSEEYEEYKYYAFIELMMIVSETKKYDYYEPYDYEQYDKKTYSQILIEMALTGLIMDDEAYANLICTFLVVNSKKMLASNLKEMLNDNELQENHKYIINYIKNKLKNA